MADRPELLDAGRVPPPARLPAILLETGWSVYGVGVIDWRRSRVVAGMIVAVFFVVQLALPIVRLTQEGSQRFGWQMYSAATQAPEFEVTTADETIAVDLGDFVPATRAEVDLTAYLPAHLCSVIPGAETVSWTASSYEC